jgi:hypothetical protein
MKYFIIFFFIVTSILTGCKKERELPQSLLGKWEVRHVSGSQVATKPSALKAGNGDIIEFSDSQFQRFQNGKVISKGTYILIKDSTKIDGIEYADALIYNNESLKHYVNVSGNKLMISIGSIAFDGMTVTYERMR